MILFYNAFVYLEVIAASPTSRSLDRRVGRQFTIWYVCLGARPLKIWPLLARQDREEAPNSAPEENGRSAARPRPAAVFDGLIPKQVGPIIKGNLFVLAWHLKDRHLVSRQRCLCGPAPLALTYLIWNNPAVNKLLENNTEGGALSLRRWEGIARPTPCVPPTITVGSVAASPVDAATPDKQPSPERFQPPACY